MTDPMHIGVLEDNADQQEVIKQCLIAAGHRITQFRRASELRRAIPQKVFDLFIVGRRLPDASGLDVTAHLRQHDGWKGPILLITSSQTEEDIVQALDSGADDIMAKPLRPRELSARINALARRTGLQAQGTKERLGAYSLDIGQREVQLDGERVTLTEREFRLASLFFNHPGELLSRAHLLEVVWGIKGDVSTRTVDTHISRLRRKLTLDGSNGVRLRSIYQHGYRLETQAMLH